MKKMFDGFYLLINHRFAAGAIRQGQIWDVLQNGKYVANMGRTSKYQFTQKGARTIRDSC
jgi:hypothetical protein